LVKQNVREIVPLVRLVVPSRKCQKCGNADSLASGE
jgi:hypothetical protein